MGTAELGGAGGVSVDAWGHEGARGFTRHPFAGAPGPFQQGTTTDARQRDQEALV